MGETEGGEAEETVGGGGGRRGGRKESMRGSRLLQNDGRTRREIVLGFIAIEHEPLPQ